MPAQIEYLELLIDPPTEMQGRVTKITTRSPHAHNKILYHGTDEAGNKVSATSQEEIPLMMNLGFDQHMGAFVRHGNIEYLIEPKELMWAYDNQPQLWQDYLVKLANADLAAAKSFPEFSEFIATQSRDQSRFIADVVPLHKYEPIEDISVVELAHKLSVVTTSKNRLGGLSFSSHIIDGFSLKNLDNQKKDAVLDVKQNELNVASIPISQIKEVYRVAKLEEFAPYLKDNNFTPEEFVYALMGKYLHDTWHGQNPGKFNDYGKQNIVEFDEAAKKKPPQHILTDAHEVKLEEIGQLRAPILPKTKDLNLPQKKLPGAALI